MRPSSRNGWRSRRRCRHLRGKPLALIPCSASSWPERLLTWRPRSRQKPCFAGRCRGSAILCYCVATATPSGARPLAPTAERVVTASLDGTARIWDAASGGGARGPARPRRLGRERRLQPRRRAGGDRERRRHGADLGRRRAARSSRSLRGHGGWVGSAAFSPDGERVVTASADRTARIWDADERREEIRPCAATATGSTSAAFSPDGARVVTASHDGTARIWDAASGAELRSLRGHGDTVCERRLQPRRRARGDRQRGPHGADLGRRRAARSSGRRCAATDDAVDERRLQPRRRAGRDRQRRRHGADLGRGEPGGAQVAARPRRRGPRAPPSAPTASAS